MVVGICVGETNLNEVTFISNEMPQVGQYVTIEYDGKKVLGMVENLVRGNDATTTLGARLKSLEMSMTI